MAKISASILGFFFESVKNKESEKAMIDKINKALASKNKEFDFLHLDIKDNVFVPGKSFSVEQIKKIKCKKKKDAHFMVKDYKKYFDDFLDDCDILVFHNEVIKSDFNKIIKRAKSKKKLIGISLNPETPINDLKFAENIDLVLLMSVNPGKPGQKFISETIKKIEELAKLRKERKLKFLIEVDGGINSANIEDCKKAGADMIVMGSYFFKN